MPVSVPRRRLLLLAPLGVAAGAAGAATALLLRMQEGTYDPHALPSQLVGKPLPDFKLAGQPPSTGFSSADVRAAGHPVILNFFASWCLPCAEEAPGLAELQARGVALWGIAYKDKPEDTAQFLQAHGNPYQRIGRDATGEVGIDFGLYGVPESYLVDTAGIVRWRWVGGLSGTTIRQDVLPRLKALA